MPQKEKEGMQLWCSICGEQWEKSWKSAYYCPISKQVVPSSDGVADQWYKPRAPACARCGQIKGRPRVAYVPHNPYVK